MVTIEKIIPGGQALGTHADGRKIFFWNALPGEIVKEYEIIKQKSYYYEAIALEIDNPSRYRRKPKDDCFLATSPWQIFDFDYENRLKAELVSEIFNEHKISIEIPELISDHHDYFYRNKMEYSLYWNHQTQKIQLAFHKRGSHQKIPIQTSSIERPELFTAAQEIINHLNDLKKEAREYQSLLLRCNQNGQVSGGLFKNNQPHPVFQNLTDELLGKKYSYSPNGFFQINLPIYELALQEIQKHIDTEDVLDLYAGVGTIGLSVARDKFLTLVEVDKSAYQELLNNVNNIQNATAILDKSENVLNYLQPDSTVILDPPRAGCDKKLIDKLNEVKPRTIIYLSCNPATQARDIKFLLEKYQIKLVKTYNFFPHTPHIENLVVLKQ